MYRIRCDDPFLLYLIWNYINDGGNSHRRVCKRFKYQIVITKKRNPLAPSCFSLEKHEIGRSNVRRREKMRLPSYALHNILPVNGANLATAITAYTANSFGDYQRSSCRVLLVFSFQTIYFNARCCLPLSPIWVVSENRSLDQVHLKCT